MPENPAKEPRLVAGLLLPITQAEHAWAGALAVLVANACWALFCWRLDHDGHMPSRTLVPIARDGYYAAQARFVVPLSILLWALCSATAAQCARALGGTGRLSAAANGLGLALAAPLVLLFLVPELFVYAHYGFAALRYVVRVTAPLSFVTSLLLASLTLRASHGLSPGRSFVAAAAGLLVQSMLGAILLR